MSEPQHVQKSIKVGVLVNVVDGPHKGKKGKVVEIYTDWHAGKFRAFIELPGKQGVFQTRVDWLVRMP